MGSVYVRGNPVNIVKRFFNVDPLTQEGTPEDPDVVTWSVMNPNNESTDYVFGIDDEVTNPAVGVYLLTLDPQLPVGAYIARCEASGTGLIGAEEFAFDIVESGVLPPDPPKVAVYGPCQPWINGDDVAAFDDSLGVGSDTYLLDDVAWQASTLMYAASGRQFSGVCQETARPCASLCGCWSNWLPGNGAYWWGSVGGWFAGGFGVGPYWVNDYGGTCGCGTTSVVRLAGYPLREILEVKIDGVILPEFDGDTGARNWRLDRESSELTRMWIPNGTNPSPTHWPSCQNLSLDDDQPTTFSVKYQWGMEPPLSGRNAAAQFAAELWKLNHGGKCRIPNRVTKVVRQGVTFERLVPLAAMIRQGATGLEYVDAFIAEVNPNGMIRRPMVWTPDDQQFARRLGQG